MADISRSQKLLALALLVTGLLGHVVAADMLGGYRIAYIHHVLGFFLIAIVTGVIIFGAGRLFWRNRTGVTLLVFAAVQAILGILVIFFQQGIIHG